MSKPTRGVCIIFSNMYFSVARNNNVDLGDREGTDKDHKCLQSLFHQLGFDVHIREDKTALVR